jgi:hypothetical protein
MDRVEGSPGLGNASSSTTPLNRRSHESTRSNQSYDLSAATVADGFRPGLAAGSSNAPEDVGGAGNSDVTDTPSNNHNAGHFIAPDASSSAHAASSASNLAVPASKNHSMLHRPSSVSKPHRAHDSLTLHNDGSSSTASGSGGLFQGPLQPSHPYQLYPQRTFSNASSSTASPHPMEGSQAPAHPYALYPQTTIPSDIAPEPQLNVGFGGMGGPYQRQIGPDGEEAGDLIGPLGHTEQLPPYTRYPPEAHVRPVGTFDTPSVPVSSNSLESPVDGAVGIEMATRNPDPSSTGEDLALSRSRPSVRTVASSSSQPESSSPTKAVIEQQSPSKWQRRARRKAWGIVPYWAICLLACGLILVGVIMGAVIGTMLANNDGEEYDSRQPSPPSQLDIVPDDMSDLVTGTWLIPPLTPRVAPSECIQDATLVLAWSCEMPSQFYKMDIQPLPDAAENARYTLRLLAVNDRSSNFLWGTQPPDISEPEILTLVNDTYDQGKGPAWWLKFTYDKTVIVPENELSPPSKRRRRGTFSTDDPVFEGFDPTQFQKQSSGAVDGDTPWICTWPQTTMEIFLYPNVNITNRSTYSSKASDDESDITSYPQNVKLLERRYDLSQDTRAFCQQVIIQGYDYINKTDENNDPIIIDIPEDPNPWKRDLVAISPRSTGSMPSLSRRTGLELTDCGCLWRL